MEAARKAEKAILAGEDHGLLTGLPLSIKDLTAVKGVRFTSGSRTLADFVAPLDSPASERVKAHGAAIIGKTTTTEFGCKGSSNSPLTGETRNPWNLGKTTGGSSAGAGASVAAGLTPFALGTDGGGSIRIPSSFCGLFGIKARTPGPPPFSSMNSTPADSNARRIAKSWRSSVPSGSPLAPRGEWWQRLVPTQRQDPPRSDLRRKIEKASATWSGRCVSARAAPAHSRRSRRCAFGCRAGAGRARRSRRCAAGDIGVRSRAVFEKPLVGRHQRRISSPVADDLIAESDFILGFGASFTQWTTKKGKLIASGAVVAQVDIEAPKLGYQMPIQYAVHGDARATAEALLAELDRRGMTSPKGGRRSDTMRERIRAVDNHFLHPDGGRRYSAGGRTG